MHNWTLNDTIECYKQGWAPFFMDDGSHQILKVDDPEEVSDAFGFEFKGIRFESDDKALEYVQDKAAKGDDLCIRALQICHT